MAEAKAFIEEWKDFLERFGHLSESGNDLTRAPWRERPEELVDAIRQSSPGGPRAIRMPLSSVDISPPSRWMLGALASRASRYSVLKERMGWAYALGYGLFRPLFLELGSRMVMRNMLKEREEIFYLYLDEVRDALSGRDICSLVVSRKDEMARVGPLVLPEIIYGEEPPPVVSPAATIYRGLATSGGYYRGPARVIRGTSDFSSVRAGDVIVIPYSDVRWSSIFARASAVISESGGILSHSSILAREYGIPSVVSVHHAMSLPDGAMVVVDGFKGQVYLDPEEGAQ
jgi:pyruvate,water dikinase